MKISEALSAKKGKVSLKGWVYRIRKGKDVVFVVLRDSTGIIQCAVKSDNSCFKNVDNLTVESSLMVSGSLREDARATGGVELAVDKVDVFQVAGRFPITKDKSVEHLMDYRHLWIRSRELASRLKIRSAAFHALREFFRNNDFYETTCPMIVGTKGEEGSELFSFDYFGKTAYLTQTRQIHLEAQIVALEKVFTIAPSFRAEKSKTRKHVTEFWHVEAEEAWCDLDGTMKTQEGMVEYLCHSIAKNCRQELEFLGVEPSYLLSIKAPFKKLTYSKAIELLKKRGSNISWGEDIKTDDEKLLMEKEEQPVFITHWPKDLKAFYMPIDKDDMRVVLCADLQAPFGFGELIGGSQRSTDPNEIISRLKRDGDDPKNFGWYLDLSKYGSVVHAGFGFGLDRALAWITKAEHIRDVIPFPRFVNRYQP